jgi:HPr Serine kinase C-terminal domain
MGWFYWVFGLRLHANQSLPGLESIAAPFGEPDVEIHLGEQPQTASYGSGQGSKLLFTSSTLSESGEPAFRIWHVADGSLLRLEYADGTKFWLDRIGRAVWAIWPDTSSREDTATYLLGPVLGFLLRLRGVTCLHASAVAIGNTAVALVGAEGAGKSTTAAALARRGHAVVSDDIVALEERHGDYFVFPAYPYLSLWPDSVDILYGPDRTLPSFSPNYDKRQLLLAENRLHFEVRPLPLGALYLLGERSAEDAAPFVETLAPRDSLLALVADSYATNLIDSDTRAKEFELLGRLLGVVPVRRLRPHKDGARIDRLCEVIERSTDNELSLRRSIASHIA